MSNLRSLPAEIGSAMALLSDKDIRAAHEKNYIFASAADFNDGNVRQASYELTLLEARGLRFEELQPVQSATDAIALEVSAFNVRDGEHSYVIINPWQCCQLMVREQIAVPDNVMGHVMARGQLFQSGLIVESTYIDPGFGPSGGKSIHLMAFNATQRQVKLPVGVPIARLELIRLTGEVSNPHGGRASIKTPEMSPQASPWPVQLKDHGEEIAAARTLRDKDVRLLAMDRITIALEGLGNEQRGRKRADALNRIYMFVTAPLLLWLMLKVLNLRVFLNGKSQQDYDKFVQSIPIWIPSAIVCVVGASIIFFLKGDLKLAFKSLAKGDEK